MKIEDYMKLDYLVAIFEDKYTDGTPCFIAKHPQLPGCISQGDTVEEALNNLTDARREYIESLIEDNLEVPVPIQPTLGTMLKSTMSYFVETTSSLITNESSSLPKCFNVAQAARC